MSDPAENGLTLEGWIRGVIAQPLSLLNEKYAEYGSALNEIEPLFSRPREERTAPKDLLNQLHVFLRDSPAENAVWDAVIGICTNSLPAKVAHDLIDRDIAIAALGHSRQTLEVQWRLASFYDEALLTLGIDYYTDARYEPGEFEELLLRFADHSWLIRTLLSGSASSKEKELFLFAILLQHHEQYKQYLEHQEQIRRAASPGTTEAELLALYNTNDPEIWAALSENPRTPDELIQQFASLKDIPMASRLRHSAQANLRARQRIRRARISPTKGSTNMRTQTNKEEGFAEVNGAQLYYQVEGSGQPLILLHAGVADHTMWDGLFERFAEKYRVVRYDLRGYGRSSISGEPFSHYEDLCGLMDFLGIERAYLAGVSMGGGTIVDFTITYPERAAAIVPIAPGLSGQPPPSEEHMGQVIAMAQAYQARDVERAAEEGMRVWLIGPRRTPEAVSEALQEHYLRVQRRDLARKFATQEGANQGLEPPSWDRLGEIWSPTLAIVGDADLQPIVDNTARVAEKVPGAELVVLPNVAHMVPMEAPDEVSRLILDFLARRDAA